MSDPRFDVVCLGILVADVVVSGIDGLPPPATIRPVAGLSLGLGGCAANTAVCLARLGLRVAVIGKLGDDPLGRFMLDALTAERVNVEGVRIAAGTATGAAVACVHPGGERGFWSLLGANGGMRPEDADGELIRAAKVLHVAGSPFLKGFNGVPCAKLMRLARAHGVLTSLDTIHYGAGFCGLVEPEMRETDLLLPSHDEARALSGESAPEAMAARLLRHGAKAVAIKMGGAGAYVADGRGAAMVPGVKVTVADTVGAGDAFVAGFLAGWLQARSLVGCAQWGNILGAQCVAAPGATSGVRGRAALLAQAAAAYGGAG